MCYGKHLAKPRIKKSILSEFVFGGRLYSSLKRFPAFLDSVERINLCKSGIDIAIKSWSAKYSRTLTPFGEFFKKYIFV